MSRQPKPRLLVTTSTLPRFAGDSIPRFVLDLSKGLQKDFDVTILAPADPSAALEEEFEGVHVVRYRYAPLRSLETLAYTESMLPQLRKNPAYWLLVPLFVLGFYRATRRLLRERDFACVHCHWLLPQGVVQALMFRRQGDPPYVVTCHGSDVFGMNHPLIRPLKRLTLRRAAMVTVVSEAIREYLVENYAPDFDRERSRVIPMGVDLDRFDPGLRDDDWPQRFGLKRPVILFVGRLAEIKGVTYLLQALALEPLRSTAASLAIAGYGPLRDELEEEAERLGFADRVRFLGAMDHRQLPTVYASADIFCAPSVVAEGGARESFGVVLCEAGASGLASVTTRVGRTSAVVRDGETGMLVDEKDPRDLSRALAVLVTDPDRRAAYGSKARERVREFGWNTVSSKYTRAIRDCIGGRVT